MTATAIDVKTLNELFDNQKKLDDLFGSFFDDEFLLSASSYDEPSPRKYAQKSHQARHSVVNSSAKLSVNTEDEITFKSKSILSLIIPVLVEIVIIYYGIIYFS